MRAPLASLAVLLLVAGLATPALAQALPIRILSVTSPAYRGTDAALVIQTAPGATCDITVWYKSGPSRAAGLYPQRADGSGRVRWVWRVGTRTTPGRWPIRVSCALGGRQGAIETSFQVY